MKRSILLLFILSLLCLAIPALGQNLEQSIEKKQDEAQSRKQRIDSLSGKEKILGRDLGSVETRIKALSDKITEQENILAEIEAREEQLQEEYFILQQQRDELTDDLKELFLGLWPLHMRNLHNRFRGLDSWEAADRRFTWLTKVYATVLKKLTQASAAVVHRVENLSRQQLLAQDATDQLDSINKDKDVLLRERLKLRRGLHKVRDEKADLESELKDLFATIRDLNYKLQSQKTKRFPDHRRVLPWPTKGRIVQSFKPKANPPQRGIGLATSPASEVRSIFWGKVVHNDMMRGFGRVVIVYHGHDYYSLYAFLADSSVYVGQEVEKDEPIGYAGLYPPADGHGLYFELRFGQKAINPLKWLFPK